MQWCLVSHTEEEQIKGTRGRGPEGEGKALPPQGKQVTRAMMQTRQELGGG